MLIIKILLTMNIIYNFNQIFQKSHKNSTLYIYISIYIYITQLN